MFADVLEEKIIGRLEVKHNAVLDEGEWRAIMGLHEGDRYQTGRIREAVQRLHQTGKVAQVEVQVAPREDGSLSVTFQLWERSSVTDLSLSGNRHYTEKEIRDALGFTQPFDLSEWETRKDRLLAFYKQDGYFEASVSSMFTRRTEDRFKMEVRLEIKEGERARIRRLMFSGTPHFSDRRIYAWMGSRTSDLFSQKRLDADMDRLRAYYKKKGYRLAEIGPPQITFFPEDHAVDVTLPIVAGTRFDLFFHGFGFRPPLFSKPLEDWVAISKERGDRRDVLEESARALEKAYRDRGYPFAAVSVEDRAFPDQNVKEAHFTMTHRARAKIRAIVFSGNDTFPSERLAAFVQLKEEGLFTRSRFTPTRLEEDAENIARFYKQNGFQEVQVKPAIQFGANANRATVTFRIEEGKQTRIGAVLLAGDLPLASSVLLATLGFSAGDPFNNGVVREGATRILTALARLGYIDAKVDSDLKIVSGAAEIHYRVTTGEQVFFGTLHLLGNEKTRDVTILREMLIQSGETYDYEKILKSQERLNQTGLFSGIRFDPVRDPDRPTVQDMDLTVVERPRFVVEWGPGFGDLEGFRGFVDVGHRNLFGSGRQISARVSGSRLERRYSLNYKEPRVRPYDVDSVLSGISFFIPRASFGGSFDEETHAGTLGFERQFSPTWKGTLQYQYEDKEISNVQPGTQLTNQDVGQVIIGSLNTFVTRDTRDDPFYPRSGSLAGITLRNAAQSLGSHVQMVKLVQQGSVFFSPTSRVTIALSERLGIARRFGETALIPLSERFFLGGQSTVRGYSYQRLGEVGETLIEGHPTGGNVMAILNEEVRVSLGRSLGGVLFFDHGNVWQDENAIRRLKSTTGLGFRYHTPAGPLRIDWGYKLDREPFEASSDYHITLGHAF